MVRLVLAGARALSCWLWRGTGLPAKQDLVCTCWYQANLQARSLCLPRLILSLKCKCALSFISKLSRCCDGNSLMRGEARGARKGSHQTPDRLGQRARTGLELRTISEDNHIHSTTPCLRKLYCRPTHWPLVVSVEASFNPCWLPLYNKHRGKRHAHGRSW